MLISKITINKISECDSIAYLNNEGELNPDGGSAPISFASKRKLMIKHVNICI